ncbi:SMI1/KNR4 family protein [Halomonas sp. RT37]|uniref:SMI1/KNR4 family protein n=1 Tax=Halomonas sp. RT37 TaxID=2950872 RepID=A0AAU7KCG8_9GAMM
MTRRQQSMRCCKKELSSPDVVDGKAYFVFPECGNVREIENYRVCSAEEALSYFEKKYGFLIPKEYVNLLKLEEAKIVKLPPCNNEALKCYLGEGFYEVGTFPNLDPNAENSIFSSMSSGREWGLPKPYVPLEGDGHTWLALDYSDSLTDPKVIATETDDGNSLVVANTFNEFVSSLLQYEEVYDLEGNIIYSD